MTFSPFVAILLLTIISRDNFFSFNILLRAANEIQMLFVLNIVNFLIDLKSDSYVSLSIHIDLVPELLLANEFDHCTKTLKLQFTCISVPPFISALVLSVTSIRNSVLLKIKCSKIASSTVAPKLSIFEIKRYSLPSAKSLSKVPLIYKDSNRSPCPGGYQFSSES